MSDMWNDVGDFKRRFGLLYADRDGAGPRDVNPDELRGRVNHLAEEVTEFELAADGKDIVGMADALIDLVYVALGTAHLLGLPWRALWGEVHETNMEKVRGLNPKRPDDTWDVIKPEGWQPPRLAEIMRAYGWTV